MDYENLLVDQLPTLLEENECAILDMRDQHSFERGHLDGATMVTDAVISQLLRNKQKDRPIVIYCYHGNSSRDLASFFCGIGFSRVFNLEGGWQAWQNFIEVNRFHPSDVLKNWLEMQQFSLDSINNRILNGMTPLMLATVRGEKSLVMEILSCNADLNLCNDDGNNALWFACVSENPDIVRMLIDAGIELDTSNVNGATPLIYSASAGKLEMVRLLVEAGADLHLTTADGFNALDSAATLAVLKYLKPHYVKH